MDAGYFMHVLDMLFMGEHAGNSKFILNLVFFL